MRCVIVRVSSGVESKVRVLLLSLVFCDAVAFVFIFDDLSHKQQQSRLNKQHNNSKNTNETDSKQTNNPTKQSLNNNLILTKHHTS
jgi:GMP synthase PP-ATPase subunit